MRGSLTLLPFICVSHKLFRCCLLLCCGITILPIVLLRPFFFFIYTYIFVNIFIFSCSACMFVTVKFQMFALLLYVSYMYYQHKLLCKALKLDSSFLMSRLYAFGLVRDDSLYNIIYTLQIAFKFGTLL